MEENTAVILVLTAILLLFSPFIALYSGVVVDITGVDRMLPYHLVPIVIALLSTAVICGILAPVMKLLGKPTPWIKMALIRIAIVAYLLSYLSVDVLLTIG
ncbi:hypothetical protein A3L12_00940 [Thermococcus sp. P6]|uniref:hypothetical protein n=1 Tax=Thermococcus sp. P6 TaxID=122420 RepID=UPI000B59D88A|nr:hypothetical protein [Thermococcus sp. P6]ASJ09962.1 hypothetical protein A3L12_00940 [Thermococcus sp. P6]